MLWPAKTVKPNLTWFSLIYLVWCLWMTRKSWHIKKICGGPLFTMLNVSPLWLRNIQWLPVNSTIKFIFISVASEALYKGLSLPINKILFYFTALTTLSSQPLQTFLSLHPLKFKVSHRSLQKVFNFLPFYFHILFNSLVFLKAKDNRNKTVVKIWWRCGYCFPNLEYLKLTSWI